MTPDILPTANDQESDDSELVRLFLFLQRAYELGAEKVDRSVAIWTVGRELALDEVQAECIANDLQEMNLLYYSSLAGDIALTSFGVSEIVLARSQPDQATTHFPPLSSMTDQMMLPLNNKVTDNPVVMRSNVMGHRDQASVKQLVDQLESCNEELQPTSPQHQIPAHQHDLSPAIDRLDQTIQDYVLDQSSLVAELEEIQLELAPGLREGLLEGQQETPPGVNDVS